MTDKIELLPCPFCGEPLVVNNANLGVHPRFSECLFAQQVVVVDDPAQVRKWNTRAAPAEDVRAVGDEPVAYVGLNALGTFRGSDGYVMAALKPERYLDIPLYRHPQRPVVLPERLTMRPFQTVDRGSTSYKAGYNACLDEYKRLNP